MNFSDYTLIIISLLFLAVGFMVYLLTSLNRNYLIRLKQKDAVILELQERLETELAKKHRIDGNDKVKLAETLMTHIVTLGTIIEKSPDLEMSLRYQQLIDVMNAFIDPLIKPSHKIEYLDVLSHGSLHRAIIMLCEAENWHHIQVLPSLKIPEDFKIAQKDQLQILIMLRHMILHSHAYSKAVTVILEVNLTEDAISFMYSDHSNLNYDSLQQMARTIDPGCSVVKLNLMSGWAISIRVQNPVHA